MKKIIIILFTAIISFSCASGRKQLDEITSQVYPGMSIADFNNVVAKKRLVGMKDGIAIYKVYRQVWYDTDASGSDYRYFYFTNGILTQMDQGERAVDYRIKIDTN
jgi:hypothetical protein